MKEYELVVLYHPDLEVDMSKTLEKVAGIISKAGGKILSEDDWGRRKLAYKINKEEFAIYRVYDLELPAEGVKAVNDALNISTEVLRFLLTAVDPKVKALMEEDKKLDAEEDAEADEEVDNNKEG